MAQDFPELGGGYGGQPPDNEVGYNSPSHPAYGGPPGPPSPYNKNSAMLVGTLESGDPFTLVCIIAGCSFVVMIQSAVECGGEWSESCENEYVYAVVVGVLSFIVSLLVIGWSYCAEALFEQFSPVIASFFLVWWAFGTFVTTNKNPFKESGNGYFASWTALITAFVMAGAVSERLRSFLGSAVTRVVADTIEARLSMGILVASVVLLIAVAFEASDYENPTAQEAWGVIVAVISFLFVLIHTILRLCCENITCPPTIFGAALSVWWLAAVGVLTFDQPFKTSGNGYFATWAGFVLSVWLALEGLDGYGGFGFGKRKAVQQMKEQQAEAMGMGGPPPPPGGSNYPPRQAYPSSQGYPPR